MKDQQHTPEPWKHKNGWVVDEKDQSICSIFDSIWRDNNQANAQRIVDCVNACAGLTLEEIEKRLNGFERLEKAMWRLNREIGSHWANRSDPSNEGQTLLHFCEITRQALNPTEAKK